MTHEIFIRYLYVFFPQDCSFFALFFVVIWISRGIAHGLDLSIDQRKAEVPDGHPLSRGTWSIKYASASMLG